MGARVDNHVRRGHPIVFTLIWIFAVIEMALAAWLVGRFNSHHNYNSLTERDRVRYVLFISLWTILLTPIYAVMFWRASKSFFSSIASHLVFLTLTWIMWTAGAAAVTEMLGGGLNCSANRSFVYCHQLDALEAFAWIEFILLTVILAIVIARAIASSRNGNGYRGSLVDDNHHVGGPNTTQTV